MYMECRQYLIDSLKAAGIKTNIYTELKKLKLSGESHIGAVLFNDEKFEKDGSKTIYRDDEDKKHKRVRSFRRHMSFVVVIGEYTTDAVEVIFDSFLENLKDGLYVNGNYITIDIEESDWMTKEDSILKAQISVQFLVTFNGGIYRNTDYAPLSKYQIDSVELNMGD